MMKLHKLAALMAIVLCGGTAAYVLAQTPQEEAIKKVIESRLEDGAKIDSIRKTPYSGLYELRIGGDILYTDAKGDYVFIGRIVDTRTMQDQTRARIDEITKIKFADLPFDAALKTVKGNGKRVIAVFEDPNCGYCKRFRQTLGEMDNLTVYTFMYNILSEDSVAKSRNIWCSADRNKAWDDWMLKGKVADAAPASCTTPHEKIFALGKKLRVTGTPTIFFTDGSRIPGAVDAKGLESKLASIK
ncbi:MAG TPA: DsbC family protein [Noviherbaspirillum sp.]|nr:DsbC family protein [Noviherbaspirillum sp.]